MFPPLPLVMNKSVPFSSKLLDHCSAGQACGSGGTTAGIALGNHLSGMGARVHAYGVCDDPEYFYGFIQDILNDMGATPSVIGMLSGRTVGTTKI